MSSLAQGFQARVDRPVIDKTGLKGYFDIRVPVDWDPTTLVPGGPPPDTDPQILDALGLKLESGRAMVEVLVIDHLEKPTEN